MKRIRTRAIRLVAALAVVIAGLGVAAPAAHADVNAASWSGHVGNRSADFPECLFLAGSITAWRNAPLNSSALQVYSYASVDAESYGIPCYNQSYQTPAAGDIAVFQNVYIWDGSTWQPWNYGPWVTNPPGHFHDVATSYTWYGMGHAEFLEATTACMINYNAYPAYWDCDVHYQGPVFT